MINKFKPDTLNHYSDIDEDNFLFSKLGKCITRDATAWTNIERNDIIHFDATIHSAEFDKNFIIGDKVSASLKNKITKIVQKYWDSFCSDGARRPILGYEFAINTGSHTPVCKFNSIQSNQTQIHMTPIIQIQ